MIERAGERKRRYGQAHGCPDPTGCSARRVGPRLCDVVFCGSAAGRGLGPRRRLLCRPRQPLLADAPPREADAPATARAGRLPHRAALRRWLDRPLQDGIGRGHRSLPRRPTTRRRLRRRSAQHRPAILAFNGKRAARVFLGAETLDYGEQARNASARPRSTCCRPPPAPRGAGGTRRSGAGWRTPRAEHARRQEDEAARDR